jgi:hypothetical protein
MRIQYASGLIGHLNELKPTGNVLALLGSCGSVKDIAFIAHKWEKVFVVPTGKEDYSTFYMNEIRRWDKKNIHYMIQRIFFYNGITFMGAPIEGKSTGIITEDIGFFQTNISHQYKPLVCLSYAPPTYSIKLRSSLIDTQMYWFHGKGATTIRENNMFMCSNEYSDTGFNNEWYTDISSRGHIQ